MKAVLVLSPQKYMPLFFVMPQTKVMKLSLAISFWLVVLWPTTAHAQNYPSGPTSLSPAVQPVYNVNRRTGKAKKVQPNVKHSAEYQFYNRVEKAAKNKKRALRKLNKPQYTNPLYFGHKTPPKKRPVHKMRFCQECGIRH
jgi:hypothetical protein